VAVNLSLGDGVVKGVKVLHADILPDRTFLCKDSQKGVRIGPACGIICVAPHATTLLHEI
jgi:hypothetical protein